MTLSFRFVALVFLGLSGVSRADFFATNGPQLGNRSYTDGMTGTEFTVGSSNLSVTALGFEDPTGNGLTVSHYVGLWTSGGDLLASVTVPDGTGGTYDAGWRYVGISDQTLTAGSTYVIAAYTTGSIDMFTDGDSPNGNGYTFNASSLINSEMNVFSAGNDPGDYVFPNFTGGRPLRWAPANAEFTAAAAVPEPSSIAMCGIAGALGLMVARARRRRAAR